MANMKLIYFSNHLATHQGTIKNRNLSFAGINRSKSVISSLVKLVNSPVDGSNISVSILSQQTPDQIASRTSTVRKRILGHEVQPLYETDIGYIGYGPIKKISQLMMTSLWILSNVKSKDIIMVYNFTPSVAIPIILTKLIKKYHLIIQFEEYCSCSSEYFQKVVKQFELWGIKNGDGYLTCSNKIADNIRSVRRNSNVPIAMGYGDCREVDCIDRNKKCKLKEGERLQLLYSGTLDSTRGVLRLIQFMDSVKDSADLNITGSGSLSPEIAEICHNCKNVKFLGVLSDDRYDELLDTIHVCVNPSPLSSPFSDYSFPSKIITYLSYNKILLSTKQSTIVNSPFRDMALYFDDNIDSFRSKIYYIIEHYNELVENLECLTKLRSIKINEEQEIFNLISTVMRK